MPRRQSLIYIMHNIAAWFIWVKLVMRSELCALLLPGENTGCAVYNVLEFPHTTFLLDALSLLTPHKIFKNDQTKGLCSRDRQTRSYRLVCVRVVHAWLCHSSSCYLCFPLRSCSRYSCGYSAGVDIPGSSLIFFMDCETKLPASWRPEQFELSFSPHDPTDP